MCIAATVLYVRIITKYEECKMQQKSLCAPNMSILVLFSPKIQDLVRFRNLLFGWGFHGKIPSFRIEMSGRAPGVVQSVSFVNLFSK